MRNKKLNPDCGKLLQDLVTDVAMIKEAISWLKKAVVGIYGGLGVFIIQQVMAAYFK